MSSLPKTHKAAMLNAHGADLELRDLPLVLPTRGQILVKLLACGICHSDAWLQESAPVTLPTVPGHEIIGDVVAIGEDVTLFKEGDRVGSHDGTCRTCQRGHFQNCESQAVNGLNKSGGYAEYVILRVEAAARVPRDMDVATVAPLFCAGVTVFNAIRKMHVEQGTLVAVQGLGGLGHLAVQFCRAMGYKTIAVSRGTDKRDFAFELGAHGYIDTNLEDPAAALQKLGGAAMIVSTAPHGPSMTKLLPGLQPHGKLVVLAPVGNVEFDTTAIAVQGLQVVGWPSGIALDCEETFDFVKTHGVKCMVQTFPLADFHNAFEGMKAGTPRFRNVLIM
ncbi:chaperonin 10-like protein [Lasiosphaeria ovina]|uniref:Chaperonin 10-like protein n=1 Tax=Lasiosphaeria ovina TaxID=92902 RepID=A0AAE0NJF8_9PEZI|nr:chaperonin 10-like protein [Lasiosphaeria ovina]